MWKVLQSFSRRSFAVSQKNRALGEGIPALASSEPDNHVSCAPNTLILPEGCPEGYTNHISNQEVLQFLIIWKAFLRRYDSQEDELVTAKSRRKGPTEKAVYGNHGGFEGPGTEGNVLSRPFDYVALLSELNAPQKTEEEYEQFRLSCAAKYDEWDVHRNTISDGDAASTFDFHQWPMVWTELKNVSTQDLFEQLNGKSTDDGYFTHSEDIPMTCPLMRHFIMRMLQYSRKMTFGNKNGQKCNLWRQTRKLLMTDIIEYALHSTAFPDVNLTYADLSWVGLHPRQRFMVLQSMLRTAIRLSTTVQDTLRIGLMAEDYGINAPGNTINLSDTFHPLVPFTNRHGRQYWLLYENNIAEFFLFEQNEARPDEIRLICNYMESSSIRDCFSYLASMEEGDNDGRILRSQRYPPKVERLQEIIDYEHKSKVRKTRQRRVTDSMMSSVRNQYPDGPVQRSRSGRPMRASVLRNAALVAAAQEATIDDRHMTRADRATERRARMEARTIAGAEAPEVIEVSGQEPLEESELMEENMIGDHPMGIRGEVGTKNLLNHEVEGFAQGDDVDLTDRSLISDAPESIGDDDPDSEHEDDSASQSEESSFHGPGQRKSQRSTRGQPFHEWASSSDL